MRKLSIRKRGEGNFEIGPAAQTPGKGMTVMVRAPNKPTALRRGRAAWRTKYTRGE